MIIGAILIMSCQSELDQLLAEKEGLETSLTETTATLKEIKLQIASLDTTEKAKILPKISVVNADRRTFDHYFEIQGAVVADKNVIVTPEVGGEIINILVKEGETVKKGNILATFNSDAIGSNVKEIEEQLELAEYMYEKQKSLYDKGVGTEIALKQSETQFNALKQTLSSIKSQRGKFILEAPFDGYIEEIFTVVGQVAGPGSPIIRLIDLSKMSVKADISESYLSKISKSSVANLYFPALQDKPIMNLPVKRVGKFVNPVNRTISVEIEIPVPNEHHVPNLMSVIRVRDYIDTSAIVIPSRTILRNINQEPYVFVFNNGTVDERMITVGLSSSDFTQVLLGLEANEKVVDKGARGIKMGQQVEVK